MRRIFKSEENYLHGEIVFDFTTNSLYVAKRDIRGNSDVTDTSTWCQIVDMNVIPILAEEAAIASTKTKTKAKAVKNVPNADEEAAKKALEEELAKIDALTDAELAEIFEIDLLPDAKLSEEKAAELKEELKVKAQAGV